VEALRGVADAMDLQPAIFDALADEDEGHDPNKLEIALLHDRFDRHEIYSSLAAELEEVANIFSNTALAMGALVKPVTLAWYEIARPINKRNDAIRGKITEALDFDGGHALAAAATGRANGAREPQGSESSSHMQDACSRELHLVECSSQLAARTSRPGEFCRTPAPGARVSLILREHPK
jgi:hypothetical protein